MRASLLDYLYENAALGSEIAFSHRPRLRRKVWTYAELAIAAFQFARELETKGIGHGDRVILWAENSPEWVAAFYGIILRGAIAVPLDEQGSTKFAARVCEQTEPKLVLCGSGVDCTQLNFPKLDLQDLKRTIAHHSSDHYHAENVQPSDTAEIVFTSGTTATPKGVELTHGNLLANIAPIEREINKYIRWEFLVHPLKILTVLPLSHVFGQMIGIFIPQILQATIVFQNRLKPSEIIEAIKRERASVLGAVPRVLETLQRKIERGYDERGQLAAFRASLGVERSWFGAWLKYQRVHRIFGFKFLSFVTGGATLDESTETFWRALGFAVVQGYGMTETAALVSLNNPFSSRRGSLGQSLSGRENVRISEKGEIFVRGKNISPGYWGNKKRGDEEWLDTGDIGEMDESGRLYFKGRKKDVIVTAAGLNIYPDDLEAALNDQPEMIASVVVGIDAGLGPEPAAALILHTDGIAEEVVARANKALAAFQQIRLWIEWPDADFPRTATQKIRKSVVEATIAKLLNRGVETSDVQGSPLAGIIARLSNRPAGNVRRDTRLDDDLNLDSLSRVELMSTIEDRYQIDMDEQAFTESATIADLEQIIRGDPPIDQKRVKFFYRLWPLGFPVSWIRTAFYELVINPITRLLSWVNTRGTENLSQFKGPVVFASNHVTYIDPALIMSAMPGRFRRRLAIAMDGERLEGYRHWTDSGIIHRLRGLFTYWLVIIFFNAFPLPRRSGFRESFAFAGEAMDRGYSILIFPEGELTKDGRLQEFRSGVGLLANGLEAPIVPVSISGLYELRVSGQRGYARPGSVTVTFGQAIPHDAGASPPETTRNLEDRIKHLQMAAK